MNDAASTFPGGRDGTWACGGSCQPPAPSPQPRAAAGPRRVHRWFLLSLLLPAACGPRTLGRPEPLPPEAVSGPAALMAPGFASATAGPHGDQGEVDAAALPRDPAALPGTVLRWRSGEPAGWMGSGPTPQVLWSPGNLVVACDDEANELIGYDLLAGSERWRLRLPGEGYGYSRMPPLERDGVLYMARDDRLLAVDLGPGKLLWERRLHGEPLDTVFVTAGKLVLLTEYRPPRDPEDPDSLPDFQATPETTLQALDVRDGTTAWEVAVGEYPEVAVSPAYAIVAEHLGGEEEAEYDDDAAGTHDAQAASPEYTTRFSLYRVADGAPSGSVTLDGYIARPLAWTDMLLVADDVDVGEGESVSRISALRLPSLERLWEQRMGGLGVEYRLIGDDVLVVFERTIERLDPASGESRAELDLTALLPPPPQWPAGEDWWPTQCLGALAPAGNSLVYVTNGQCAKHVVMLDGETLRPWRVTMGFDESPAELLADSRTAVLAVPGGLAAIDLETAGPTMLESVTYGQRIAAIAGDIAAGALPLGWPLDNKAKEFVIGGDAIAPAVREALAGPSIAARLFAVTVLKYRPDPEAVPAMIAAFGPPPPPSYGAFPGEAPAEADLQLEFLGRLLEALAACGDPRATDLLAGVFDDAETWAEGARLLALQGLAAIGTPESLARIDALREARSRREEPWRPPVEEGTAGRRYDDAGWVGPGGADVGVDDPTRRQSDDGKVVALIAYAAGGTSDLWLLGEASGILVPHFTGVTSTYGLGIVSVEPTADGVKVVVSRTEGGPGCAICGMMGAMEGEEAPQPVEETLEFRWADLRADADGDGWTDLLERRLRTDPAKADTDGDGLADGIDPAPRGAGPAVAGECVREEVLRSAFFGMFAFAEGSVPLFVTGTPDVNLQYEGYPGPVVWLSAEEEEAIQAEVGLDGATYFSFDQRMEEGEDGEWHPAGTALESVQFTEDGHSATVNVSEFRGSLNGIGHRVDLRCVQGKWYPVAIEMTWIS
ncbi:MAG: PQQ-binding-like beta-propeller repeat protein [Deltaproteobacteria bacterium]|nr:PQQ-binding-like beta-propeller repeat protein [Deltaproteobacteria bacterium]